MGTSDLNNTSLAGENNNNPEANLQAVESHDPII